ncbi:L,D-transpeptidase [Actinacidiphila alni]|uniref:L,D-transpeptidase n=1 Tax=Actinacidiphila alni TaxID=380248 RepID=UPI0034560902
MLVAGCGGSGGSGDDKGPGPDGTADSASHVSRAAIDVAPGDGAKDVPAAGGLRVTVDGGTLTGVTARTADGTAVPGALSDDAHTWRPTGRLSLATRYSVDAYAVDDQGRPAAKHADFTTTVPQHTFIGFFTPENDSTVGVGMIVSLKFNRPITDKKAVEDGVRVTASPSVPVTGHWFGSQRLDLRPRDYWAAGTRVTLRLRLRDVEGAPGVYGTQSKDVHFTIGRDQRSTVDAAAHTLVVRRGGTVLRTLPASTGAPAHTTYDGVMVIAEKYAVTRMNGQTVGFGGEYDIPDVPHAMRLTSSGTFVHGNYWSPAGVFGTTNVSHGCIGLRDVKGGSSQTPAGWFFDHSLIGDPIRVLNSHDRTVAADNGMGGWNLSWEQWQAGSAL